jgi:hypothetical protein
MKKMSCNLYLILEKKFRDKWIGCCATEYVDVSTPHPLGYQNYEFFGKLSGINRRPNNELDYFPSDGSYLSYMLYSAEYGDGHSWNVVLLKEFVDLHKSFFGDDFLLLYKMFRMDESAISINDYRIVFYYIG